MKLAYAVNLRLPAGLLLTLFASVSFAQQAASEADVAAGKILFQKSCTACHGGNAQGGRGPDLTSGRWRSGGSDAELTRNIIRGIPGTEMPAFPMPQQEADQIVAYLRSLGSAAPEKAPAGDSAAGRALFFGSAGCSGCHMFGGRGGRLGPDLSSPAGGGRRPVNLRQAILNPDESQRRNYESVEVHLSNGQLIRGVTKNEDTFSIQIMDEKEQLHMLLKSDLKQIVHPNKSLMPTPHLTATDLENVLAFLGKAAPASLPARRLEAQRRSECILLAPAQCCVRAAKLADVLGGLSGYALQPPGLHYPIQRADLAPRWSFQFGAGAVESVPLVVDGLMFVTGPQNNAAALDARTGRPIWRYTRTLPNVAAHCTVMANRGLAILGDRLFMGTLDSHLVSLDAKTGSVIWDIAVEDYQKGFSITHAPLAIDGKIIIGITAGECALTGFVDAYDAATGKLLWRHRTIAQRDDPARSTWPNDKAADTGGGPTWTTGTYDAGDGHALLDHRQSVAGLRRLRSCRCQPVHLQCACARSENGKRKWYFQFTPHDTHDWDANETPMLVDILSAAA